MPTIPQLQDAADHANEALRNAMDRRGQARDRARGAITRLADLETYFVDNPALKDPAELQDRQDKRDKALVQLAQIEAESAAVDAGVKTG